VFVGLSLQVVVDYVAVVMCMTDSLDERRPRRSKSSPSPGEATLDNSMQRGTTAMRAVATSTVASLLVVTCMADSLDERRPRRSKSSPSLTRSARLIAAHQTHDHRCRVTTTTTTTRFSVRCDSPLWFQRRPPAAGPADCCRNGRPAPRSAVIERAGDDVWRAADDEGTSAAAASAAAAVAAAGFSPTLLKCSLHIQIFEQ